MDEKQEQSDLPYHLPISFSLHVGGYRKSVLYHWNNKEKVILKEMYLCYAFPVQRYRPRVVTDSPIFGNTAAAY